MVLTHKKYNISNRQKGTIKQTCEFDNSPLNNFQYVSMPVWTVTNTKPFKLLCYTGDRDMNSLRIILEIASSVSTNPVFFLDYDVKGFVSSMNSEENQDVTYESTDKDNGNKDVRYACR